MPDEQVRYDILINAKAAIKELREMSEQATSVQERVAKFSFFLVEKSKAWNVPVKQLLNTFKQLNAEMAKQKTQTIFGNVGGQNIFNMSGQFLQAAQAAGRFQTSANGVVTSTKNVASGMSSVGSAAKKVSGEIEILGNRLNVVRTAFGTLLAVGIFQFISAVQGAFSTLINNLKETELAIYNLVNAERRLSEQGIEVTPQGLQETIDSVRELVPVLSQIQAEELVSRIATNVAPSLKLTNEQIKQMAEATALLYVRNKALGKSFEEVESQLTNAFLTGKVSVGINNLGVKISDQIVKDEALRMGLVETEEQFNSLTGEMEAQIKSAAMLSVVYQNAKQDVGSIGEYMETADAAASMLSTTWNDLLTTAGTLLGPIIIELLQGWIRELQKINEWLEKNKMVIQESVAGLAGLIRAGAKLNEIGERGFFEKLNPENFKEVMQAFQDGYSDAKESAEAFADAVDTPTADISLLGNAADKTLEDAEKFENAIEDILQDAANAREDLEEKLADKRTDIDTEYQRKALDAQVDYGRKVEDINRDYERDIAKIKDKQREEDLRAEENYQLKLWELRMRFLMDLEEALHARDARQVIRLQKQYEIDKEALARKQALDDKQRDSDQAAELEDAAIKRQQRLEDAKREYEEKLFDQRLAKQRELDDLNVWYKREQQDIETNVQRKLEALISGWIQEKKITEENAAAVYAILHKYFGPGGMTDQLYAYMAQKLATPLPMPNFGGFMGGGTGPAPYWQLLQNQQAAGSTTPQRRNTRRGRQMAEGGTLIATRPTTVTFGEAGAEMASFTPLSRIGRNVNTVFSDGGGGVMGQITVALNLSPDLEARVMENTMNGVAETIVKVNRSKL